MKLEDFKDGMIIRFNDGDPDAIVLDNGTRYMYFCKNGNEIPSNIFRLDNLYLLGDISVNVKNVHYMGELVWKNIKYVSFDEARKSGKRFKHKEWHSFHKLDCVLHVLSQYGAKVDRINRLIDSKEWEIEA